jgi:Uma2 family endonuclease
MESDVGPKIAEAGKSTGESSGLKLYRLSVEQCRKMIDAGIFPDGARAELLGGVLIEKTTRNPPHDFGVDMLADRLRLLLPPDWIVRQEKSVDLDRWSRPEPDIVIAAGPRNLYRNRAPSVKDIALIIEVSDSSYRQDRGLKWRR